MSARAGWLPRVDPDALDARERLDAALTVLTDEGQVPPCHTDPERWFSDAASDIMAAITACASCPVLAQCDEYATADGHGDRYGVWAARPDAEQLAVLARDGWPRHE